MKMPLSRVEEVTSPIEPKNTMTGQSYIMECDESRTKLLKKSKASAHDVLNQTKTDGTFN